MSAAHGGEGEVARCCFATGWGHEEVIFVGEPGVHGRGVIARGVDVRGDFVVGTGGEDDRGTGGHTGREQFNALARGCGLSGNKCGFSRAVLVERGD